MSALLARYPPAGPILDVGCGSGDLSLYLSQLGHQVVGIDFVETAIAQAQAKRNSLSPELARRLDFRVGDALKPSLLRQRFGAVVDSGFFHLFDPEQCDRFVDELSAILLPGGRYYMHEFAVEYPAPNVPRQVTAEELQARFIPDRGWQIREIQAVEFLNRMGYQVPAICACIERISEVPRVVTGNSNDN